MIDTLNDIWHCSKKHKKWKLDITESFYWHHTVLIMLTAPDRILETSSKHFYFLASADRQI